MSDRRSEENSLNVPNSNQSPKAPSGNSRRSIPLNQGTNGKTDSDTDLEDIIVAPGSDYNERSTLKTHIKSLEILSFKKAKSKSGTNSSISKLRLVSDRKICPAEDINYLKKQDSMVKQNGSSITESNIAS